MAGRPRSEVPPHGTRRRYQHRSEPCKCAECREANARHRRIRRHTVKLMAAATSWHESALPLDA